MPTINFHSFLSQVQFKKNRTQINEKEMENRLRGELGLLFLARPAGQSVLIPAGRPARLSLGFGRPAGRPPGYLCIGVVFGWPAGCFVGWLAGWLSGCAFNWLRSWPAGRLTAGCTSNWLRFWPAGRLAGCLASWLAGTLARLVGLATWFRILVKVSAK